MPQFPHLKLPFKVEGRSKPFKGNGNRNLQAEAITNSNKSNRQSHGQYLQGSATKVKDKWEEIKNARRAEGITLPNETDIPLFLKVDTEVFNIDSLLNWGIEVITEEKNGYIIGASIDQLQSFEDKINQFLAQEGRYKDTAAKIWELVTDENWRINQLLKGELGKIWQDVVPDVIYTVQFGVSCYIPNKKEYPKFEDFDSEVKYQMKVEEFKLHERNLQIERDNKQLKREEEVENYINVPEYNAELHDIWDNGIDAIFFKISINGKGLKDLVQTYQYMYEIKLEPKYNLEFPDLGLNEEYDVEVIAPNSKAAKVCVIDSGIQEQHILIQPAIDILNSRSYVEGESSTADYVRQNGHGTKVAGAILYPHFIPKNGQIQLETFIQNARILDKDCRITKSRFEPKLMEQIVSDYAGTRIFNLSVCDGSAYIGTHMPALAASLDKLMHENDILFVVASGNLPFSTADSINPGIQDFLERDASYPFYLDESESMVANPGVSYFAITVGSIAKEAYEDEDYKSIAGINQVSPFSRCGLGLWGCVKPDVVEYGGNIIKNKLSNQITTNDATCPELINSTLYGSNAVGKDSVGTSFSAPKVSYILSRLQSEHPNENAQMYRALLIQSARLPDHCFYNPTLNDLRYYGYGIPDVNRALTNYPSRITFIQEGKVGAKKADLYRLKIPSELRGEGKEFRILIEITLTFTAKTRLTRKGSHSYLSNWLEWKTSKCNENFNSFRNRTIEYLETDDESLFDEGGDSIKWVLRENPAWSNIKINRNNSTAQKSWAFLEPHQFADEFSLAVIGHSGWDKNIENQIPYSLCVSFEILNSEINLYQILSEAQIEIETEEEIEG